MIVAAQLSCPGSALYVVHCAVSAMHCIAARIAGGIYNVSVANMHSCAEMDAQRSEACSPACTGKKMHIAVVSHTTAGPCEHTMRSMLTLPRCLYS